MAVLAEYGAVTTTNSRSESTKERWNVFWLITHPALAFERTRIVCNYGDAIYTEAMVCEIQKLLSKEFRLWRVMLDAQDEDDVLVVYPEVVRSNLAYQGEPLSATLQRVSQRYFARREARLRSSSGEDGIVPRA